MTPVVEIREGGLDHPAVIDLLRLHGEINLSTAPAESCHYFEHARLKQDDITFWSAWEDTELLGVAALKRISGDHGEVKSMHTVERARRRGVGAALVQRIIEAAREAGMTRLSLETGSMDYFAPARALYQRCEFRNCAPFGDYKLDPNSIFMTREI